MFNDLQEMVRKSLESKLTSREIEKLVDRTVEKELKRYEREIDDVIVRTVESMFRGPKQ